MAIVLAALGHENLTGSSCVPRASCGQAKRSSGRAPSIFMVKSQNWNGKVKIQDQGERTGAFGDNPEE
jgi:hypothetical protein